MDDTFKAMNDILVRTKYEERLIAVAAILDVNATPEEMEAAAQDMEKLINEVRSLTKALGYTG